MIARWRDGVFHGWWIVATGFSLETLIGPLMFHAYGAYSTGLGATAALGLVRYQFPGRAVVQGLFLSPLSGV